ncbi:prostaglandin F2alpha synthase [Trypanosoma cruzi]|nr:prostaglandin F2alpha synthase [Trypanosoma cruzi]
MATFPELLRPLKLGRYTLRNRIIMAPLTRCQATEDCHVPRTESMLKYYEDRASAGLIIAEATMVQPNYTGFLTEPGIYSDAQIEEWRKIVDAVHKKGGLIFLQLIHAGRAGIPEKILQQSKSDQDPLAGRLLAPSAIPIKDHRIPAYFAASGEKETYGVPEELTDDEVRDGIIHCLWRGPKTPSLRLGLMALRFTEQRLLTGRLFSRIFQQAPVRSVRRNDHRHTMQLIYDVTKSVCDAVGSDRVGLRISPLNGVHGMIDSNPEALTKHLCKKIEPLSLAYLHYLRWRHGQPADW